jgi:type I restriction enzyme R subunit
VLQNYDEFASLKELQSVDLADPAAVEAFKAKHYLSDEDLTALQAITLPPERKVQDYRSTYNDVRDWLRREKAGAEKEKSTIDWDDVVFEVDLLKSQEINLDYILELIFEHNKKIKSKSELVEEVRRDSCQPGQPRERKSGGGLHQPDRPGPDRRQGQRDRCVLQVCSSGAAA